MNDMKSFWHKGETFYFTTKDVDIDLREKNGVEMATCYIKPSFRIEESSR